MLTKVLVANRGEIAVRIMQTCREMGIATVAVYSTADAGALHVQRADEAICIGPPPAVDSYLRSDAILQAARQTGADAVHPGYGFLAENAAFAEAVEVAGLIWVGPPPSMIALMGDKVAAKDLARSIGVPVVPGYYGEDQSGEKMLVEAENIGYPVMLKAAAGGGGKGMRAVRRTEDLLSALEGAQRESVSAFGDDRVFLEQLLVNPRHVEVQVLADSHGSAVYLGERDCSLQRRHQKVVEEAPASTVPPALREAMGRDAVRYARDGGYVNAGTVEFLVSGPRYYFLEMNTRIQVEHPVTEMVTGLDLVRLQLQIAAGLPLPFGQGDVVLVGHAIEARIYAEDPRHNFVPSIGVIEQFQPPEGAGIRNDVGVFAGAAVSPYYDPLLAKLIVHADTRDDAFARLQDALGRYTVSGVTTNIDFLRWIGEQEAVREANAGTTFLEEYWKPAPSAVPVDALLAAAAWDLTGTLEASGRGDKNRALGPWRQQGAWRISSMVRPLQYRYDGEEYEVAARRIAEGGWELALLDVVRIVRIGRPGPGIVLLGEGTRVASFEVTSDGDRVTVTGRSGTVALSRREPSDPERRQASGTASGGSLSAPMPGTVVKVAVAEGQSVNEQDPLLVLEAMKMEHVIRAPYAGIVSAVLYGKGDLVPGGAPVVKLERRERD